MADPKSEIIHVAPSKDHKPTDQDIKAAQELIDKTFPKDDKTKAFERAFLEKLKDEEKYKLVQAARYGAYRSALIAKESNPTLQGYAHPDFAPLVQEALKEDISTTDSTRLRRSLRTVLEHHLGTDEGRVSFAHDAKVIEWKQANPGKTPDEETLRTLQMDVLKDEKVINRVIKEIREIKIVTVEDAKKKNEPAPRKDEPLALHPGYTPDAKPLSHLKPTLDI